jgi:hypothetical protein
VRAYVCVCCVKTRAAFRINHVGLRQVAQLRGLPVDAPASAHYWGRYHRRAQLSLRLSEGRLTLFLPRAFAIAAF